MIFLPAATKLGQGNVFTGVCDSVHGGDQADTPRDERPPDQADPPPPGPGRPRQTRQTLPDQADTPPGSRHQHTVNEQPVRILLECILVIL